MTPSTPSSAPLPEAQQSPVPDDRRTGPAPAHDDLEGGASLRALLDAMPELCWTGRPDGIIDYHSRRWYEFTGLTPADTRNAGWGTAQPPHLLRALERNWRSSLDTGETFEAIFQLRRHDGLLRWFLTRANPMRDREGRILRWLGVTTDIDAQKQEEDARAAAGQRLESEMRGRLQEALQRRSELLATVSQDLRNPLNIVLLAAKQVEHLGNQSDAGARSKKTAHIICNAAERMKQLVGDLLDQSQLEAGQALPIELARQDIAQLIGESRELLDPMATAHRLRLESESTPSLHVSCDKPRIQQVLSNLIRNGMKFTGAGGVIAVRSRTTENQVVISVSDTGCGISEEHLPHIFRSYWQFDPQGEPRSGWGLSIAKAIIDAHGGRIWVESAVGVGSTFHFSLPRSNALPASQEP